VKLLVAIGAACTLSSAATAAPVYLSCVINSAVDGNFAMDIQLNEEAGTVSYTFPDNGRSFSMAALFAPDRVSFGGFQVSRTDLSIYRTNNGVVDHGTCKIDTRHRAF
jgi:hypothetical protein